MKKLKKKVNTIFKFLFILIIIFFIIIFIYNFGVKSVSNKENKIIVSIPSGSTSRDIANILIENNVIRNETAFLVYLKLSKDVNIQAGIYNFNCTENLFEVFDSLKDPDGAIGDLYITFPEGKNITQFATIIANNTNNTVDMVIDTMKDEEYLLSLEHDYWFITEEIENDNLYYPLEGYLFADTYMINVDDNPKKIISLILNQTDKVLSKYKEEIVESNNSVHKILTIASVVQLEGGQTKDFSLISGVFYNRISQGISLGSDITSYYGVKKDIAGELKLVDINDVNPYNTRGPEAKLIPIGPVANCGEEAIKAAISPEQSDYLFFVSDKNGKIYYTKTNAEHESIVSKLKSEGLWFEW